nr:hypothetical protein [Brucella intermedia]
MKRREAIAISGMPQGQDGDEGIYYLVGADYNRIIDGEWKRAGRVTRITVTDDLPGLHCNMERVRVFDGETMIFEAPLHSLESILYAPPVMSHA